MPIRKWRQPGYRLLAIFFATVFLLVCLLGWMGWRLVQQDRQLARQRLEERREHAANIAVTALKEHLAKTEALLAGLSLAIAAELPGQANRVAGILPEDSLLLMLSGPAAEAFPPGRLLLFSEKSDFPNVSSENFSAVDTLEFRASDYLGAVTRLRDLSRHPDPAVRAEAQVRMG